MKIINFHPKQAIIPNVHQLVNLPYYHSNIDKAAAKVLLLQAPNKNFLLHKGDTFGAVTISYKWCHDVYHKQFVYVAGNSRNSTDFCLSLGWDELFSDHHKVHCLRHQNMICWYSNNHWQPILKQHPSSLYFLAAAKLASNSQGDPKYFEYLSIQHFSSI